MHLGSKWQPEHVIIYGNMSGHWTPEEYERRAEQLKKAVERLKNEESQEQHGQSEGKAGLGASAKKKNTSKKTRQ